MGHETGKEHSDDLHSGSDFVNGMCKGVDIEQLGPDGRIAKQWMRGGSASGQTPSRGTEMFFHFRILVGDQVVCDSRSAAPHGDALLHMRAAQATLGPTPQGERDDAPQTDPGDAENAEAGGGADAWDLALGSMRRGESAMFMVHGARRRTEMLARDFVRARRGSGGVGTGR
ncbi:hypothetical protein T484DRAFT_1883975, partial [Baffinella frigidus]